MKLHDICCAYFLKKKSPQVKEEMVWNEVSILLKDSWSEREEYGKKKRVGKKLRKESISKKD